MIEYFNTVQLTEGKGGQPRCLSDRNARGPPPGEAAEYVTTWCVHRLVRPQQMDDDWADASTNSAGEPARRARRGLSEFRQGVVLIAEIHIKTSKRQVLWWRYSRSYLSK